ncbi:MAG: hypothetical protein JW782_04610 [Candidatus Saganbacteria bacterium]|nr:hypothetical protein [Candidatus Saganbacteria bacterium]
MKRLLVLLITITLISPALATSEARVTLVSAEAAGGPLRIVDFPLVWPSPFSPARQDDVVIQYTLSEDADIDMIIVSSGGEIIKKMSFQKGEPGGKGELNKVVWDGLREFGRPLANGIYLGIIMSRSHNKVLGNFKLTAYN